VSVVTTVRKTRNKLVLYNMYCKESSTPVKRPGTPLGAQGGKRMYFAPSRTPTPPPREWASQTPQAILESITTDPDIYRGNITCIPRVIPERAATFQELSPEAKELIDVELFKGYSEHVGSSQLFSHQAETIEALLVKKWSNICISTSTSSGKSMAFNLPILSELMAGDGTALYIYPTKALTQDQKRVLDLLQPQGIVADVLDGDVKEMPRRKEIMESCNVVLTNPDMVHFCILYHHRQFSSFLKKLRFVVVDEAHAYHGAFGGHVASIMRRLRRVVEFHKTAEDPPIQFVLCSATIGNPAEHVSNLVGIPCDKLITNDGSPSGQKILTVWNSKAGESMTDIVRVLRKFVSLGVRFICFCKNRFATERLLTAVRQKLDMDLRDRVVSYRAGYSVEDRRRLEEKIFSGSVVGVIATTALELGMDIGALDVAVSFGFPGSIHSLWQQWGRAGRGSRSSLCMLFCKEEDVLDSFIGQDADERLLELDVEDAVTQVNNPTIVKDHLICADQEIAMKRAEEWTVCKQKFWPHVDEGTFTKASKEAPFVTGRKMFSIRNIDARKVKVECDRREIDSYDITKAVLYVYPGAVHFVQGEEYRIVDLKLALDGQESKAIAVKATHDYVTRPYDVTTVTPQVPALDIRTSMFFLSKVDVSLKVNAFVKKSKKKPYDTIPGGYEALELPTIMFNSYGAWIDLNALKDFEIDQGSHGALHALFFAACRKLLLSSQSDVRCCCGDVMRNKLIIYDCQKDGVGAAEAIFKRFDEIIKLAIKLVTECPCATGCMRCLLVSNCSANNELINKTAALALLDRIMEAYNSQ